MTAAWQVVEVVAIEIDDVVGVPLNEVEKHV